MRRTQRSVLWQLLGECELLAYMNSGAVCMNNRLSEARPERVLREARNTPLELAHRNAAPDRCVTGRSKYITIVCADCACGLVSAVTRGGTYFCSNSTLDGFTMRLGTIDVRRGGDQHDCQE